MSKEPFNNDGWYMPAEWTDHVACLVLFPHNPYVFRCDCKPAQDQVLHMAQAIARHGNEDVFLFCISNREAQRVKELVKDDKRIFVKVCASDDTWARDTGPTFCKYNQTLVGLDWEFNAYGGPIDGCYWPCDKDRLIASNMCRELSTHYAVDIPSVKVPLVLEGGSIHVDGEGTALTTKECLLHPNRNPSKSQEEIETMVTQALDCSKILWLPLGLAADEDTNGHVDNIACFIRPGHVLLSWCDDKDDDPENFDRCRQAMAALNNQVDAKGRKIVVHKLMLPPPMYYTEEEVKTLAKADDTAERVVGERLAASYINFYIANEAVTVPQFGYEEPDKKALDTIQSHFPNRKVIGIPSREILLGGGNIHCITQQLPKVGL